MNTHNYIATLITLILITTQFSHGQVELDPVCAESVEQYGVSGFQGSSYDWFFDHKYGEIIDGVGTDTVSIRWGYPVGTIQIEVLERTAAGCTNVPSLATIEIMAPFVNLGDDFPEICRGDSITLDPGGYYGENAFIEWHNGSNQQTYTTKETEQIWVHVIDEHGCSRYDTVSLLVNELPTVYLGEDTLHCDQANPLLLEPGSFAQYEWTRTSDPDEGASINYFYEVDAPSAIPDTIILTATDNNGCVSSDTTVVFPCDLQALFKDIPNTITANDDDVNDEWNIPYMHLFPNAVLEIFDRWGRLVYRSTNVADETWDGTSAGKPLPMDAYYFVLNLNVFNAEPIVGTVNLIR